MLQEALADQNNYEITNNNEFRKKDLSDTRKMPIPSTNCKDTKHYGSRYYERLKILWAPALNCDDFESDLPTLLSVEFLHCRYVA